MTSTYFALMAEFGSAQIELGECSVKYFGLGIETANRRAGSQALPVPSFKIATKNFIKAEVLAQYIDEQSEKAMKEWQSVNN